MDRRLLLAILLMLGVTIVPSLLWPPQRPPVPAPGTEDTAVTALPPATPVAGPSTTTRTTVPAVPGLTEQEPLPDEPSAERRVVVESDLYRYEFTTQGARLLGATLLQYRALVSTDSGTAQLLPPNSRLLAYAFVVGGDTLPFDRATFEANTDLLRVGSEGASLTWTGRVGARDVRLVYRFRPDAYVFDVEGEIGGGAEGVLTIGLGPRLRSVDADTVADIRSYGVVTKANRTERLDFRSLDPGEVQELAGPFEWVAIKSKYFLQAVLALEEGNPQFGGALVVGGPKPGRFETDVTLVTSLPVASGRFQHSLYVGPQEFRRLARIGHDLEDVNPYGWIFRPIIRPFANFIVRILLWMHETLSISYGWVLILFGIMVRVLLWPLNQKAMRSSTAMQAIQPELKALQDRYKNEPQKLQQEMMKLYKEHGVNPLGGCVPMLIPMPVLFALFFVFANTIEFRGVSFLWLPDLARADPYYIIPVFMGVSMFVLSWLGQRGVPPNPQAKMMMYVMPVMFTFLFLKFSSGLNLYYAVSNVASLPQQWLISRERARRLGGRGGGGGPG
ncbi:MAG: membrane protein insertase YidC [Gemmatimonadota bacterium]|nr:membrane protein insertase YidC [Gemmatimonadota bacterium]